MTTADEMEEGAVPSPRKNPDLLGHQDAEGVLHDAYQSGRLAHAWIVGGPRGIGKATLAFRMARYLLADRGNDLDAPGLFGAEDIPPLPASLYISPEDPIFRRVASGGHADLLTIERGFDEKRNRQRTEITVDEARQVSAFLSRTSAEGGWRVVIVDGVESMNSNAANALLKILEEPPRRAILMLVSHNPGRLLPTIRSRCRFLGMSPLSGEVMNDLLERYQPGLAAAEKAALHTMSRGSIGHALALIAGDGLTIHRDVTALLSDLPNVDVAGLHRLADKIGRDRTGDLFGTVQEVLSNWLTERTRAQALTTVTGLDRWFEVWEKTQQMLRRADSLNLDRKQLILNTFFLIEDAAR